MIFKCEFCQIELKSDLDVSKHLVSQTHRDNVDKARQLHPLENERGKDMPKNIVQLFENLKLRTVGDVQDLADRGYFNIPSDATETAKVIDTVNHVLAKNLVQHLSRNMPAATRQLWVDAFDSIKSEPTDMRQPSRSNHSAPVNLEQDTQFSPEDRAPTRRDSPTKSQNLQKSTNPPKETERPNSKRPADTRPIHTPRTTMQVPRPNIPTQHRAPTSNISTTNPNPVIRPPRVTPPNTGPHSNVSIDQSSAARIPDQMSTWPSASTANSTTSSIPVPTKPAPPPMMGASFMPRPSIDEAPPQPRPDSTYRPRLARIKIEPKEQD